MRYLLAEVHHLYIDRKVDFIELGWVNAFYNLKSLTVAQKEGSRYELGVRTTLSMDIAGLGSKLQHLDLEYVIVEIPQDNDYSSILSVQLLQSTFPPDLFPRMPKLEILDLHCSRPPYEPLEEQSKQRTEDVSIELTKLKRFHFTRSLYGRAIMPNLLELDYHDNDNNAGYDLFPIATFALGVDLPKRLHLNLHHACVEEAWLISILPELHQLRFLGLAQTGLTGKILPSLIHHESLKEEERLCPNLVALSLASEQVLREEMIDLVNSRLPTHEKMAERHEWEVTTLPQRPRWEPRVKSDISRPRIGWLCLDGYSHHSATSLLRTRVAYVSSAIAIKESKYTEGYVERARGRGEDAWDRIVD